MSKNDKGQSDPVLNFLGGIVDKAVAPVIATCEVMANGKVSDNTAEALCKGFVGDSISGSLTEHTKK